jgi:hypothetical protein
LATNSGWDWGTFAQYVTAKSVMAAVWLTIPLIVQLLLWFNIAYLYQTLAIGIPFGPAFFTFNVNSVISGSMAAIIGLALHRPPTRPRSFAPASSPSIRVSSKRLLPWAFRVSVMAIAELFYQVQVIYGRSGRVVPMLVREFDTDPGLLRHRQRHDCRQRSRHRATRRRRPGTACAAIERRLGPELREGRLGSLGNEAVGKSEINPPGLPKKS